MVEMELLEILLIGLSKDEILLVTYIIIESKSLPRIRGLALMGLGVGVWFMGESPSLSGFTV